MRQQEDWYAYLSLATDAATEQIEQAVERLSRQATALAVTAPERSQRLRDTVRSIKGDLLSGAEARARYDAARSAALPSDPVVPSAAEPPATPPAATPPAATPPAATPPGRAPARAGIAAGAGAGAGPVAGGERISSRIARFLRTGWTCAECGKEALPSDKFCTRCGTVITPTRHDAVPPVARVACVNCAAPLGINDAFCARCGARVVKLTVTL